MIKNCPKCNVKFEDFSKWGPKQFCSRKCANSRIFSEEAKHKKSIALKGRKVAATAYYMDPAAKEKRILRLKETYRKKYLETPFDKLGMENRRRRVFEEQKYCCLKCGLTEWLGKKLTLELEHKDGNNQNNTRENLEGLCPNCHSITDTWRGRNKPSKNRNNEVTDEFLLKCLNETASIRQGLLKAGIAAKGNNYNRAKKLLGL